MTKYIHIEKFILDNDNGIKVNIHVPVKHEFSIKGYITFHIVNRDCTYDDIKDVLFEAECMGILDRNVNKQYVYMEEFPLNQSEYIDFSGNFNNTINVSQYIPVENPDGGIMIGGITNVGV